MAVRVKRNGTKILDRSAKLKLALKQGRNAEAENVLTARKRRIDATLRSLRTSLKEGPVHVVAKSAPSGRYGAGNTTRSGPAPSSEHDVKGEFARKRYMPAD